MNPRQLQIPISLVFFLIIIAVANGLADTYHWYWTVRWLDIPMHFAGGAWLAGFGAWWQFSRKGEEIKDFWFLLCVCLAFALSIGFLWEVYEAVVSYLTVGRMNAIPDTISDLLFDILGGTTVAILVWASGKLK